jgi:hypothetical protein
MRNTLHTFEVEVEVQPVESVEDLDRRQHPAGIET